jgi:hypothetical protein
MPELKYSWNGVDTNFTWRGTERFGLGGLRVNGGTTTGRAVSDLCSSPTYTSGAVLVDGPNVQQHDGVTPACNPYTRWETNVRGSASYTFPSTCSQPGVPVAVGRRADGDSLLYQERGGVEASSAARATQRCPAGDTAGQVGCFRRAPASPRRLHGESPQPERALR